MRLRRLGPGLVIIATLGCGAAGALPRGPAPVAPEPPPPRPVCAAAVVPGQPALCMPENSSEIFVVGLPPAHGWERGDWVMLDVQVEGQEQRVPMAMAVVMERYPDLARVQVLYQAQARSLDGAAARRISKEDRARLGKYVGRVQETSLARVRIDVGGQDYVAVGDVYQVLSERDHAPVGRLQVTEVGEQWAWAKPLGLGVKEELRSGLDVVYLQEGSVGEVEPAVLVLVVNFDPHDAQSEEEAQAGRGVAKDLADALAKGAEGTRIQVRYEAKERVPLGAGDAEGHKAARGVGQRFGADVVVWGAMRCGKRACAQPRFTVVDPERLQQGSYRGADVWVERDDAGFAFRGEAPADPVALGAAMLGAVAYEGQRYGDASHYLGLALSKGVLRGEDELQGLRKLACGLHARGQTAAARAQATALMERGLRAKDLRWEHLGRMELALIDSMEGRVSAARRHLEAIRKWSEMYDHPRELGRAVHELASLEAQQGRVEEARKLYQQSLVLKRRVGDVREEAVTLQNLAHLEGDQGRVEEARKLYQQALEMSMRIGSILGEAAALHNLANLERQQGRTAEAHKLYRRSLAIMSGIGYVRGEATTLRALAEIEVAQGRPEGARKLYQQSLELHRRIGNVLGEAVTLRALAGIEASEEGARKLYHQSMELNRRIGYVAGEAATLHGLAGLEAKQGRVEEARKLYQQSLDLRRRFGRVKGEAATLYRLAGLEAKQGRVEEARELYQQSIELVRRIDDGEGELAISLKLSSLDFREGKYRDARQTLEQALVRARALGYAEYQARALDRLGSLDRAEGKISAARERWTEALAIYRRLQMPPEIEELTQQLASLTVLEKAAQAWQSHATLLAGGGVVITGIQPNGQAAKVGIVVGDILIRYNASRLDKPATLQQVARTTDPSKAVTLELLRGASKLAVQVRGGLLGVVIADLPPQPAAATRPPAPRPSSPAR